MVLDALFSRKKSCALLVNAEGALAERHRHFQEFLNHNNEALSRIAELEAIAYDGKVFGMGDVRRHCDGLLQASQALSTSLSGLARGRYGELAEAVARLDREIAQKFEPPPSPASGPLVVPFAELSSDGMAFAGSKATNLATLGNVLHLPVPDGFVISAHAFRLFMAETGLAEAVARHLSRITPELTPTMEEACAALQERIRQASLPPSLSHAIMRDYAALESRTHENVRVALRSSAVGEDTEASFAGQYLSCLHVTRETLFSAYKEVLASKYTPRAILYRMGYGLEEWDTPMCVAVVVMVNAQASGVLYTQDPFAPEARTSRISAVLGLGELLVGGEAAFDSFLVDNETGAIAERQTGSKENRLDGQDDGGTVLQPVPEAEQERPAIDDETVRLLARHGSALAEHFGCPQDVEWAVDASGALFFLQARPLMLLTAKSDEPSLPPENANHVVLLNTGGTAARGAACGTIVRLANLPLQEFPEDAILVAATASPDYAALVGKIKGIITETGSPASHLASVAREFAVPAIFGAKDTSPLRDGQKVTMLADTTTVYEGILPELIASLRQPRRHIFESPAHRRLLAILDLIAPLTLTDPAAPSFTPGGCRTIHDIVRFAHETAMREMFFLAEGGKGGAIATKLTANIPLSLYCIDLGGGLRPGLTTCNTLVPDHFESLPMQAIWKGLAHPGITWSGSVQVGVGGMMGMMAASATANIGGSTLGGNSYAVLAKEYLNLSAKFGYHYANVDAYCSADAGRNHILLQFAGGVGTYAGRSLRLHFLANVLNRLGYTIKVTGDRLEAALKGADQERMALVLDQTGRLLAVSRLLDMAIPSIEQAERMTEAFFNGDYDFLNQGQTTQLPGFYTHVGLWSLDDSGSPAFCRQDGSRWGDALSTGVARLMGRMVGANYQEFMDTIEAYYYFPIAIAKESAVTGDAAITVSAMTESGVIDQAAGLAFALRNLGNYFVLRFNALEDNVILFEFIDNRRITRASVTTAIAGKVWYRLKVEIREKTIKGYLDDALLIEYSAERSLDGFVGLWTKADSVSSFGPCLVESAGGSRAFGRPGTAAER